MASFESFVLTMVRNLCKDLWKRKTATELESDTRATSTAPQEEIDRQHLSISLCNTIHQDMTESERELFEMKAIQGLAYETISERSKIPVTTHLLEALQGAGNRPGEAVVHVSDLMSHLRKLCRRAHAN